MSQSQDYFHTRRKMADVDGIWFCEYCTLYEDSYCFIKSVGQNLMMQNVKTFKHYFQYYKLQKVALQMNCRLELSTESAEQLGIPC